MKQWALDLIEHFKTNLIHSLTGELRSWLVGLSSYLLIGVMVWLFTASGRRSLKEALAYLFPRDLYTDPTARISHWHYVLMVFLWTPFIALMTFAVFEAESIRTCLTNRFVEIHPVFKVEWQIVTVQCIALTLITSLAGYLHHLGYHKIPFLWSFHRAHHSVEGLTLPALIRDHPLELISLGIFMSAFTGLFFGVFLYLTGSSLNPSAPAVLALIFPWHHIIGIFNHSHVPVSFGWMNRIFEAPVLHQIHHSAESRHRDKNFGGLPGFAFWDWNVRYALPSRERRAVPLGPKPR